MVVPLEAEVTGRGVVGVVTLIMVTEGAGVVVGAEAVAHPTMAAMEAVMTIIGRIRTIPLRVSTNAAGAIGDVRGDVGAVPMVLLTGPHLECATLSGTCMRW